MGSYHPPPKSEPKAVAALLLGLSSMACLGAVTGLPAIILGALARKDIDRSRGTLTGSGMAAGGIVTGFFGTGLGFVALLYIVGGTVDLAQHRHPKGGTVAQAQSFGALDVIDVGDDSPLRTQLGAIVRDARAKGRTVVLQTQTATNPRCAQVAATLTDHRMQHALANVTLVRVDVDRHDTELRAMRVETKSAPWFYKLDASALPTDAISAEEIDTNVESMAPTLGRFVRR